ncbi:hypothetical protein [Pseudoxanthomonas wuyuanensis]|uniref:Uncharacterized protein n=1 Tax=Pseudoxanthomonas wuyuanensis TaxID=1073196 RepID=A0A286D6G3_9GAMM|nr:hypothetical protein [Pseudoxanthomonas wuyuanensis]SOD54243.1 hypothetical protein SAMN06296416_103166 [Pseudoxanthomonas wuyuanensis]
MNPNTRNPLRMALTLGAMLSGAMLLTACGPKDEEVEPMPPAPMEETPPPAETPPPYDDPATTPPPTDPAMPPPADPNAPPPATTGDADMPPPAEEGAPPAGN